MLQLAVLLLLVEWVKKDDFLRFYFEIELNIENGCNFWSLLVRGTLFHALHMHTCDM